MSENSPQPITPLDATLASAIRWVVPCALLPLFFGVIGFVGWFVCYWNFLPQYELAFVALGLGAMAIGVIGFLVGATVLIARIYQARQLAGPEERRRVLMHTGFLGTLLIANFPLAFFMAVVAAGAFPAVAVHIDNQTNQTLVDVTLAVESSGETHVLGNALGGRVTRFRFRPDSGAVSLTGELGGAEVLLLRKEAEVSVSSGCRYWCTLKSADDVETLEAFAIP